MTLTRRRLPHFSGGGCQPLAIDWNAAQQRLDRGLAETPLDGDQDDG